jgi:hypothetical protein
MKPLKHNYSVTDYSSVVDYGTPEKRAIIHRDMERESLFQQRFEPSGVTRRRYDVKIWPFARALVEMLPEKGIAAPRDVDLMELHKHLVAPQMRLDSSGINEISRNYYDRNPAFDALYTKFAREVAVKEWLSEDGIFQLSPTIRFYFPRAEGFNWRLNYHTDIMLGHPPQEINIWIPLTNVYGSNSMRLMSLDNSLSILRRFDFDFKAYAEAVQTSDTLQDELNDLSFIIEAEPGEAILFDSRCLHVLQKNQTEHSRVSMDLRVMPLREYSALDMKYVGTGRRQMPFTTSQYYSAEIVRV